MTTETYTIEYQDHELATVTIDEFRAREPMRQMVEFWSGHEARLRRAKGDYITAWLRMLAGFMIVNGRPPIHFDLPGGDEGWTLLPAEVGIEIIDFHHFEPDEDEYVVTLVATN